MNRLALMVLKNLHKIPGLWTTLCRHAKHPENYPETERIANIRKIMQAAVAGGNVDLVVTGLEKVPQKVGMLVVGNHQGLFDVVALVATWERILARHYKIELKDTPLIKQIAAASYSFAMDREDVRQSLGVIKGVTEEIQKGRNYLIYPEGTRSKNGNVMGEWHGGSFKPALKAKCPIQPVCVIDAYKVLDQKGSKRLTCQLHFLDPIPNEEFAGMKTNEIADMVKARVQACIDANI